MKWILEYKKSLKNKAIEEPLDLAFYRPLGFLAAKFFSTLPVTPNMVTYISLLFGILAGILYSFGWGVTTFMAGFLYLMANIFDCADGQLARLKQMYSDLGRLIDGFADYATGLVVLIGMGIGYSDLFYSVSIWWLLIFIAGIFNFLQAILLDTHRYRYMALIHGQNHSLQDEINAFSLKLKQNHNSKFETMIIKMYIIYSGVMKKIIPTTQIQDISNDKRNELIQKYTPLMREWTVIGTSTRITVAVISSFFNRPDIYLFFVIIPINMYIVYLQIKQSKFDSKFKIRGTL